MAAINLTQAASSSASSMPEDATTDLDMSQWVDFNLNISGRIDYKEYRGAYEATKRIIEKTTNCSEEFKGFLKKNVAEHSVDLNLTFPQIAIPKSSLLKTQALYYKEKYNIEIQILTFDEFVEQIDQLLVSCKKPHGLIITQTQEKKYPHVTPIIYQNCGDTKEAIILDAIGWEDTLPELPRAIIKHLNTLSVHTYVSKKTRQADYYSCRTDSLMTLRNALLDLHLNTHSMNPDTDSLMSFGQLFPNSEQETWQTYNEQECKHIPIPLRLIKLPLEWDYTSQITNHLKEGHDSFIPRDAFSSSQQKKDHPRTVEQFRAQQKQQVTIGQHIHFYPQSSSPPEVNEPLRWITNDLCSSCHKEALVLEIATKRMLNSFLVRKGFKMCMAACTRIKDANNQTNH